MVLCTTGPRVMLDYLPANPCGRGRNLACALPSVSGGRTQGTGIEQALINAISAKIRNRKQTIKP